ncbi:MAG: amidohydrolase/deacetylase family metallohydrolase [Chloroflexi bacterium]|nr:amidohydrolase/deacetylase family metallohydrolase [Chloroflexota bacterium]MCI0780866.1 amidohydrolase/deacetylase family metallohydrolase [Chloroflexota bacterium]MCI0793730.1 amidohydrolase/deacetylase family metallohydrolase [Chloroflexota bacterium]MCI0799332.1 amidohydrolase/deacetylase family metallohydrolase [Chloroflexota bacterium]MCI0858747.1 amidohydrolase/deacetylase family metallohydrolase [Chloroflexota bacterium]
MYDLLIKGGTVIDPSQSLNGPNDLAVQDGLIARIAPGIASEEATRVVDVRGKMVVPGLIDLHTHVYDGVNGNGVEADLGGVRSGVTTMVDAGSAGCDTFGGFPRHIIPDNATEIICFLHICRTGLATTPDIFSPSSIDLDKTIQVASENRHIIAGIKARMVSPALEIMGMEMPRLAKRAATEAGIKLMVHIGDTEKRYDPNVIRQLLPILEQGDIVTHLFTANPGGVLDGEGKVVPEAMEAKDRGVWLDTAHGRMNFSFDVGERVVDQGLVPHCISTDLTLPGRARTVHSMTEMMTRFLTMGFTLEQVITMSTLNPAMAVGVDDRLGTLAVGRQADISVLDMEEGDWVLYDVVGGTRRTDKAVVPVLTVKKGEVFEAGWGPRPWGWEPDTA